MNLEESSHCRVNEVGLTSERVIYLDRMLSTLNIEDLCTNYGVVNKLTVFR